MKMTAMEENRWGILYCPKSGVLTSPQKRWEKVEKCLQAEGISYDYVQSESSGSVDRLVKMLKGRGHKFMTYNEYTRQFTDNK